MELTHKKFEIFPYSDGVYKVLVKDKNLARRVNDVLNYYEDYKFKDGEEPLFTFYEKDKVKVLAALRVKS